MRFSSAFFTIFAGASLVTALPTGTSTTQESKPEPTKKPWSVYSLREQPFDDAMLSFVFTDPSSGHETKCKTNLPMSGFSRCEDGKTSFVYGGVSYQYGETWLTIQRSGMQDCSDGSSSTTTNDANTTQGCKSRSATGTLNLPSNFWQQPGWNSWVHPEELDVTWSWSN